MRLFGRKISAVKELVSSVAETLPESPGKAKIPKDLRPLLVSETRFAAFSGALIVRGVEDFVRWNDPSGWRRHYEAQPDLQFFASDILGGQFGILPNGRVAFMEPEAGEIEEYARSVEEWARAMLDSGGAEAGLPLLQKWEDQHGCMPSFHRLVPPVLFVLGGDAAPGEMTSYPEEAAMQIYAGYASQLASVNPGEHVRVEVSEDMESDSVSTLPPRAKVYVGEVGEGDTISVDGTSWSPPVEGAEWILADSSVSALQAWTPSDGAGELVAFVDVTFEDESSHVYPALTQVFTKWDPDAGSGERLG